MNDTRAAKRLAEQNIEACVNHPLAPHTSFRIGGPARLAVFPKTAKEAAAALAVLREEGVRTLVLGNGTNVLIADEGFDGAVVILTGMKSCEYRDGLLQVGAGASVTHVAAEAAKLSLSGMEFAYGIPGTVGGGIYMNAGAYGGEMAQITAVSRWYDPVTGTFGETVGDAHGFAYRRSVYMESEKVILSAAMKLEPGDRTEIEAQMADYLSRRRDKQPLEYPSAGSTFKRPEGYFAAKLIEDCGLKGLQVGGAQVSEKHSGFVVNKGGATCADVLELCSRIYDTVLDRFGVPLEREVELLGKAEER